MYTSKMTKRLLAQTKAAQQHETNDGFGSSVAAVRQPRNPNGTVVPESRLPVKHQRLRDDVEQATDIPAGNNLDDDMPVGRPVGQTHTDLVQRATRADASETVVRSAESPLLLGPVASRVPPRSTPTGGVAGPSPTRAPDFGKNSVARGPGRGRVQMSPSPAPGASMPPRPPSQQTSVRPGSAAVSSTGQGNESSEVGSNIDFASELEEIGRLHRAEKQAADRRKHQRQGATPAPSQASVSRAHGPTPGMDDLDATAVEEDETQGRTATGKPLHVLYTPDIRAKVAPGTAAHSHLTPKPMGLRDYQLLAEACQRAGRARMEAHAYYKIAELLSADKESRPKSVGYFKRYLNLSRRLNDLQGEAKALNCLGIVHYELGGQENLHQALDYHRQHAEIADAAGIFIANTNMGLAHRKLGDHQSAIDCFKHTLKYAVRAGDRAAESLALANLGQAGSTVGDFATARVCVERHLELSAALNDVASSCEAYEQLGSLALQRGDYTTASENFLQALEVALRENDQDKAKQLRCQVGVVQALMKQEGIVSDRARAMGAGSASM